MILISSKVENVQRIDPNAIAESLVWLSKQPKNCWTHGEIANSL